MLEALSRLVACPPMVVGGGLLPVIPLPVSHRRGIHEPCNILVPGLLKLGVATRLICGVIAGAAGSMLPLQLLSLEGTCLDQAQG
jgi:hypothetical protein